jgi:hypothetical protein
VIRHAILDARAAAWSGAVEKEWIADLMDAVHNIPGFINDWQRCDEGPLRDRLRHYDEQWASKGSRLRV